MVWEEWTEVLGSERLTGALLDRLTHHVHILEMNGDSYTQTDLDEFLVAQNLMFDAIFKTEHRAIQ